MMRKVIIVFLMLVSILICDLNIVHAAEDNFSDIYVVGMDGKDAGVKQRYSVLKKSNDVMFRGEDLAKISGYTYSVDQGKTVFKRGYKEIKIDLNSNSYTVFRENNKYSFVNKIIIKDDTYYFSAAEMLPWLNVNCVVDKGVIYVDVDENSYWDIYEEFNAEKSEMMFDFETCCEELGVKSNKLAAMSYLKDDGVVGIVLDLVWIPGTSTTVGERKGYMEIFEGMFEDAARINKVMDDMAESAEGIKVYLELAEKVDGLAELSKEVQMLDKVTQELKVLEDTENFLSYLCLLETDNSERMMWLKYLISETDLDKDDEMISAAQAVYELYDGDVRFTDYGKKFLYEISDNIVEAGLDYLTGAGAVKAALDVMGVYTAIKPNWVSGVNKISKYDRIANECFSVYVRDRYQYDTESIESQRAHAMMFLYASECNWGVMADYAATKDYELSKRYTEIANQALEWQTKLMQCSDSTVNDSLGYGTNNNAKTECTNILKNKFSSLNTGIENDNSETPENNENTKEASNLIKATYYDGNGELKYYYEYKYDRENLVEELYYEENGVLFSKKEYRYDEKGNCIREKEYDSDDDLVYDIRFEYDQAGNCIREYGEDEGYPYEKKMEYNKYNHLTKEVHYDDEGKIEYYCRYEFEYDSKGNPIKRKQYDVDNQLTGYLSMIYDSNCNIIEMTMYDSSGEFTMKYEMEYDSDSNPIKTNYSNEYGYVGTEEYNDHGDLYKKVMYNESGRTAEELYKSYTYDSKGNIRSETNYEGKNKKCTSIIEYEYSSTCDIKAVVTNNYWYQYEPMTGGYTRYKFFEDGTYQSLWIVDYVPENQLYTGNYKIEGDKIILDGYSAFTSYYNEQLNVLAFGSFVPSDVNPMYGSMNGDSSVEVIISTDKYYEEYSDEMIKYLDSILSDKREECNKKK